MIGPGVRVWRTSPDRFAGRLNVAATYWHFVGALWLCLFAVFYLL